MKSESIFVFLVFIFMHMVPLQSFDIQVNAILDVQEGKVMIVAFIN